MEATYPYAITLKIFPNYEALDQWEQSWIYFLKRVILEIEAVGVTEAGAEDDLRYQDPDVDQDDLENISRNWHENILYIF